MSVIIACVTSSEQLSGVGGREIVGLSALTFLLATMCNFVDFAHFRSPQKCLHEELAQESHSHSWMPQLRFGYLEVLGRGHPVEVGGSWTRNTIRVKAGPRASATSAPMDASPTRDFGGASRQNN